MIPFPTPPNHGPRPPRYHQRTKIIPFLQTGYSKPSSPCWQEGTVEPLRDTKTGTIPVDRFVHPVVGHPSSHWGQMHTYPVDTL